MIAGMVLLWPTTSTVDPFFAPFTFAATSSICSFIAPVATTIRVWCSESTSGFAVSLVRANCVVMIVETFASASACARSFARCCPTAVSGGSLAGSDAFSAWRTRITVAG